MASNKMPSWLKPVKVMLTESFPEWRVCLYCGDPDFRECRFRVTRKPWGDGMRTRNFVIAAGTAIALVAGGSAAVAATMAASSPVNSSGTISACYNTKATKAGAFAVALQDTGTACPGGTTAISWNQTGPIGPAGPAGGVGPTGPARAQPPRPAPPAILISSAAAETHS